MDPDHASAAHDPAVIDRLVRTLMRLRRVMVKPATATLPLPSIGRRLDIAKIMACHAVADAAAHDSATPFGAEAPTVKDIAFTLELDHSTASRLLGEAEADGLVIRGTDPTDRRRTTVELSELGRAVTKDSATLQALVLDRVLAEWDAHDLQALTHLLDKLASTMAVRLPDVMHDAQVELGARLRGTD